jgi:hypothetical protein
MTSPLNFAAFSPHFSFTIPCVQTKKSRYELQKETDIKYTSEASVIQLKSTLHIPVVLFYKSVLKIKMTSPHDTTVRLIVLNISINRDDVLPYNNWLALPVGFKR